MRVSFFSENSSQGHLIARNGQDSFFMSGGCHVPGVIPTADLERSAHLKGRAVLDVSLAWLPATLPVLSTGGLKGQRHPV